MFDIEDISLLYEFVAEGMKITRGGDLVADLIPDGVGWAVDTKGADPIGFFAGDRAWYESLQAAKFAVLSFVYECRARGF